MLTPDFLRKPGAIEMVVAARPDVFNHNLETVPRLYRRACGPGARYFHSLRLLRAGEASSTRPCSPNPASWSASARRRGEVLQVMDDLRAAEVDFLTIGQYLQPTPKHAAVERFVDAGGVRGLRPHGARPRASCMVSASPLTRWSYHAGDDFAAGCARPAPRAIGGSAQASSMPTHAEQRILPYTPGAAVRPGRRCRALSRIPALVRRRAHHASATATCSSPT